MVALPAVLLIVACGGTAPDPTPAAKTAAEPVAGPSPAPIAAPVRDAADLRSALNTLLQEHTYLTAAATGAVLGNRDAEFLAAAGTLDGSSVALAGLFGAAYNREAEQTCLGLWRARTGMLVDYARATAANDQARRQQALAGLDGYRRDFDNFIAGANPNVPGGAVAELLRPHVADLVGVVDAQAANDAPGAYDRLKQAADRVHTLGDPLAAAIARQFPEKLPGSGQAPPATLRSVLNQLFQEHVYLVGFATSATLGRRDAELRAAAGTLDENTVQLGQAIDSAYGAEAERAFLRLWRAHIEMLADYTRATATSDHAARQRALADLDGYRRDFDAFLSGANEHLPPGAVAQRLQPHIARLTAVVDAQASGDWPRAYATLRGAGDDIRILADTLAEATVRQFPAKFR